MRVGDRVETKDGPGRLVDMRETTVWNWGRPHEELRFIVEFPDGHRRMYLHGVWPATFNCTADDIDESAGLR